MDGYHVIMDRVPLAFIPALLLARCFRVGNGTLCLVSCDSLLYLFDSAALYLLCGVGCAVSLLPVIYRCYIARRCFAVKPYIQFAHMMDDTVTLRNIATLSYLWIALYISSLRGRYSVCGVSKRTRNSSCCHVLHVCSVGLIACWLHCQDSSTVTQFTRRRSWAASTDVSCHGPSSFHDGTRHSVASWHASRESGSACPSPLCECLARDVITHSACGPASASHEPCATTSSFLCCSGVVVESVDVAHGMGAVHAQDPRAQREHSMSCYYPGHYPMYTHECVRGYLPDARPLVPGEGFTRYMVNL